MRLIKYMAAFMLLAIMVIPSNLLALRDCDLPISNEVVPIGPGPNPKSEIELEVWGFGYHGDDDEKVGEARLDAQKAACNWMLFDPALGVLLTSNMRTHFRDSLQTRFFCSDTISTFITSISTNHDNIMAEDEHGKKYRKVKVNIVVNYQKIRDWLEDRGLKSNIRTTRNIMVLPWIERGGSPLEVLEKNPDLYDVSVIIKQHLPGDRFEVTNPGAEATLLDVQEATDLIEDNPDDYLWRTALALGSDIYFVYKIQLDTLTSKGLKAHQSSVTIEAYETATAKQLGAETGFSERLPLKENYKILNTQAFAKATEAIKKSLQKCWVDYLENGEPYRLAVAISDMLDEDLILDGQDCFLDGLEGISKNGKYKELQITEGKIEAIAWLDVEEYDNTRDLRSALRKWLRNNCDEIKIGAGSMTSKLLLNTIEYNE